MWFKAFHILNIKIEWVATDRNWNLQDSRKAKGSTAATRERTRQNHNHFNNRSVLSLCLKIYKLFEKPMQT